MISLVNGEVSFDDGLTIPAHASMTALLLANTGYLWSAFHRRKLSVPCWSQYELGLHTSCYGHFQVEASVSDEARVDAVFLSHDHGFYEPNTPLDGERRVYHEGIIVTELCGQREFPWGNVFCRYDREQKRDWLVIVYNPFVNVPMQAHHVERVLKAHEPLPEGRAK